MWVAWVCLLVAARLVWLRLVVTVSDPVVVACFVCLFCVVIDCRVVGRPRRRVSRAGLCALKGGVSVFSAARKPFILGGFSGGCGVLLAALSRAIVASKF